MKDIYKYAYILVFIGHYESGTVLSYHHINPQDKHTWKIILHSVSQVYFCKFKLFQKKYKKLKYPLRTTKKNTLYISKDDSGDINIDNSVLILKFHKY